MECGCLILFQYVKNLHGVVSGKFNIYAFTASYKYTLYCYNWIRLVNAMEGRKNSDLRNRTCVPSNKVSVEKFCCESMNKQENQAVNKNSLSIFLRKIYHPHKTKPIKKDLLFSLRLQNTTSNNRKRMSACMCGKSLCSTKLNIKKRYNEKWNLCHCCKGYHSADYFSFLQHPLYLQSTHKSNRFCVSTSRALDLGG